MISVAMITMNEENAVGQVIAEIRAALGGGSDRGHRDFKRPKVKHDRGPAGKSEVKGRAFEAEGI